MILHLGDLAPNFDADSTEGRINLYDYIGDSWLLFVSHPKDFTPVCTTELGSMAYLKSAFDRRGIKLLGISIDTIEHHQRWKRDISDITGAVITYPMIADQDLEIVKLYGMVHPLAHDEVTPHATTDNSTVRSVFVISPDKKIKTILVYPMSTGRNFQEILRIIDSLQLTERASVATPADWQQGDDVIILNSISDEAARQKFPQGWKTIKPYFRMIAQPKIWT